MFVEIRLINIEKDLGYLKENLEKNEQLHAKVP